MIGLGLMRALGVVWYGCLPRGSVPMSRQMIDKAVVHIVDDDESPRRAGDSLCRSVGLQTRAYGSAQEFLDATREDVAGCLVLDVRLPGMSGLDFQSQLAAFGITSQSSSSRAMVTSRCQSEP